MPLCPSTTFLLPDRNYTVVANAAARPTGGSLITGMTIYQVDIASTLVYDGGGWVVMSEPARSWANPFTNITGGSQTFTGYYQRSDGYCDLSGSLAFGAAPSAMTNPAFTLPVAALATRFGDFNVQLVDTGSVVYGGLSEVGTTSISCYIAYVGASYITAATITLTAPFTWGAGDIITVSGRYRMTTRYS